MDYICIYAVISPNTFSAAYSYITYMGSISQPPRHVGYSEVDLSYAGRKMTSSTPGSLAMALSSQGRYHRGNPSGLTAEKELYLKYGNDENT